MLSRLHRVHRLLTVLLPVAACTAGIAGWWAATVVFDIPSLFLPDPVQVAQAGRAMPGYLAGQAWVTLREVMVGFALAVATGLATAALLAVWRPVERALMPPLIALNAVPKVAVAPLLILWLGFGPEPKIALVWLVCVFPILLSALAGLTSTPAELAELARSLTAGRWRTFTTIRLPYALPQVFTGLKLSIQLAVVGAVVAEVTSPNEGLGALIVTSAAQTDTPLAFAAITVLAALNVALFYMVAVGERLLLPWAKAEST
ncbi:ABC transporter permease [Actinoplanes sp. NPDC089786]|uniref:ABC transporter permease n=1 Tax=Actinoplanes sp. NPDC089786 TaxID=3155185 RepID=UPI00343BC186